MTWGDFETLFKATCKHINESYKSMASNTANIVGTGDALADAFDGLDGRAAVVAAVAGERNALLSITRGQWRTHMDSCLAYGGTQLDTPSAHVAGGKITNFAALMRDIRADMDANSRSIVRREVTFASEPTADDDGIIQRVTVDQHGERIEGGRHNGTLDVEVTGNRSTGIGTWQSEVTISPRNQAQDIFGNLRPTAPLVLRATNPTNNGGGFIAEPNIQGTNTQTADATITTLRGWTLSGSATHVVDTTNKFRNLAFGHKIYGTATDKLFTQPLRLTGAQRRYTPHGIMVPVFKSGSPTGNVTINCGSKSQVWTMAGLSAGWNYLTLDRDADLYPDNFDEPDATIVIDVECTTGSASAYVTIGAVLSAVASTWNGVHYFHWSRNGTSTLGDVKTIADSMTSAGKNATALALAYDHNPDAWLISSGSPTLADYT